MTKSLPLFALLAALQAASAFVALRPPLPVARSVCPRCCRAPNPSLPRASGTSSVCCAAAKDPDNTSVSGGEATESADTVAGGKPPGDGRLGPSSDKSRVPGGGPTEKPPSLGRLVDSWPKMTGDVKGKDGFVALMDELRVFFEELSTLVDLKEPEALVDLKKLKDLKGLQELKAPKGVQDLRERSLQELAELREELIELMELKELTQARDRLEKATAETTERVRDAAVEALEKGLEAVTGGSPIKAGEETETLTVTTYFFGKEGEFWEDMQANGVMPRRLFLYSTLGAALALGGNLFGVTSGLLGLRAGQARDARLDTLYPVGGLKRCFDAEDGYEFVYPKEWVGDTYLELQREKEKAIPLDSPSPLVAEVERSQRRRQATRGVRPDAAFGPPGGDRLENVSVVKSSLPPGFSLRGTLGPPQEAAERLLSKVIAPPSSGKEWKLLDAFAERRGGAGEVYQFEYTVVGPNFPRLHSIGVVAERGGDTLYTMTVLAPDRDWPDKREKLTAVARSFRLI